MSINIVQFQKGLSMAEFMQHYGTEAKSYRALYRARWPQGFRCPAGGDRRRTRFRRGRLIYYQCRSCRHPSTLLSGTLFQATKLPLRTWTLAIHLFTSTKTNMAALELMRHLGVNDKAAWRIKCKVMQAMATGVAPHRRSDWVQIDDSYLGEERHGGKRGRGSENQQALLIALTTAVNLAHPRHAVIEPVHSCDNDRIKAWQARHLAPNAEVFSDGLFCFRRFAEAGHLHTVLKTEGRRAACEVRGARRVNVLLVNVKRAISGSYHAIRQRKYARLYLAEAAYRFNRRFRLHELLPELVRVMMLCKPHSETTLHLASNFHS